MEDKPVESNSSSSESKETITLAYTESIPKSDPDVAEDLSTLESTSSYSSKSSATTTSVDSLFASLDGLKEKELSFGYHPVWRTMSTSVGPKLRALEYLWTHNTFQLFSFMMTHLLAHTPEEPIPFLISLVDRCLQYRDEDGEPPLLFEDSHIQSVYTALDPVDDGTITYSQYLAGMNTLGLTEFNIIPENMVKGNRNVPKDAFLSEAKQALLNQFNILLGKNASTAASTETEMKEGTELGSDMEHGSVTSSRSANADGEQGVEDVADEHVSEGELTGTLVEKRWSPSKILFKNSPYSINESSNSINTEK